VFALAEKRVFEISWSELLILAVVVLIFVGPKDLPVFFNTLGRYTGMIRRQANEFRRHFDEAMREAEMEALRKELDSVRKDVVESVREAERSADSEVTNARKAVENETTAAEVPAPLSPPASGETASAEPAATAVKPGV
jgi:sec-independent protein translocase protein TatB